MDKQMAGWANGVAHIRNMNLSTECLMKLRVMDGYWILTRISLDVSPGDSSEGKIDFMILCALL